MDHNRVSRNDPCPCGSGKKYKHCCLPKEVAARQTRPSPTITDPHGKPKKRPEYPIGTWLSTVLTTRPRPRSPPG